MHKEKFPFVDLSRILDEVFGQMGEFSEKLQCEMEKNFPFHEKGFGEGMDYYPSYAYPPMNVYLTQDKSLVFELALAGFRQEDLDLKFQGDSMIFSAKAPQADSTEGLKYLKKRLKLKEIEPQRYYVPEDKFDRNQVSAQFKNGLLRIVVPSRTEVKPEGGVKVNIQAED